MLIYSNFVQLPNTFYIKATHTLQMCSISNFRQKRHSNHWALWFSYYQTLVQHPFSELHGFCI